MTQLSLSSSDRSAYGRFLVAQRTRTTGTCAYCGAPFHGYPSKRYCCDSHRALASYLSSLR